LALPRLLPDGQPLPPRAGDAAPNLAHGLQQLNSAYAQAFNRRHRRRGHLFGGRYQAILVEREPHLLELSRYVVLNPLRTRRPLVSAPEEWPWSSYRATAGLAPAPAFLHLDWLLAQFGRRREQAQARYRAFVREAATADPWAELRGGLYLGSERFLRSVSAGGAQLDLEIPRLQAEPVRVGLERLLASEGKRSLAVAYREHGYRLREIAAALGVHYSTVSRRLRAEERR
jgi:putative transposase